MIVSQHGDVRSAQGRKIHDSTLLNQIRLPCALSPAPQAQPAPIIIYDADGAPQASPWHHLVSPIRFVNGWT